MSACTLGQAYQIFRRIFVDIPNRFRKYEETVKALKSENECLRDRVKQLECSQAVQNQQEESESSQKYTEAYVQEIISELVKAKVSVAEEICAKQQIQLELNKLRKEYAYRESRSSAEIVRLEHLVSRMRQERDCIRRKRSRKSQSQNVKRVPLFDASEFGEGDSDNDC